MFDLLILIYFGAAATVIGLMLTLFSKKNEIAYSTLGGGLFLLILGLFTQFLLTRN